jgi:hypothetical protein
MIMGASDKIVEARRLRAAAENGTLQGAMTGGQAEALGLALVGRLACQRGGDGEEKNNR